MLVTQQVKAGSAPDAAWRKGLRIRVYADGADLEEMLELYERRSVDGFTTNPTLMRKAGVADYETFAKSVLAQIPDLPISFEVVADEFAEMERQP